VGRYLQQRAIQLSHATSISRGPFYDSGVNTVPQRDNVTIITCSYQSGLLCDMNSARRIENAGSAGALLCSNSQRRTELRRKRRISL
jgi:hypothetical protein